MKNFTHTTRWKQVKSAAAAAVVLFLYLFGMRAMASGNTGFPDTGMVASADTIFFDSNTQTSENTVPLEINEVTEKNTIIHNGIYAGTVDLSGLTEQKARKAVQDYVDSLAGTEMVLKVKDKESVTVTAGDLGFTWANPDIIDEALSIGAEGNFITKYKALKDLEINKKILTVRYAFDEDAAAGVIEEKCSSFNQEPVAPGLTRNDETGEFTVVPGASGLGVNVEVSAAEVTKALNEGFNGESMEFALRVDEVAPEGKEEDLAKIGDVLGTFTTSYSTSGSSRSANVANGARLINGTVLFPGEEFSTYNTVKPFTADNGYYLAGSYLNGMVVDSLGGGICQVSSTLYNAVLYSELEVLERNNHSMVVTYVKQGRDAAIAESAGKDFKFRNNLQYPIYIEGHTKDKKITFTIYGVETRDVEKRKVEFVTDIIKTTVPETETIIPDASKPVGFVSVQSAHIGYIAKLWKVVTEDDVEVSREEVNKSSYKATPRTAVVGIYTENGAHYGRITEAVASGSIDNCRVVAAGINQENAAAAAAAEQPAQ